MRWEVRLKRYVSCFILLAVCKLTNTIKALHVNPRTPSSPPCSLPSSQPRSYSIIAALLALRQRRRAHAPPSQSRSLPAIADALAPSLQPHLYSVIAAALAPVIAGTLTPIVAATLAPIIADTLASRHRSRARISPLQPRSHLAIAAALAPCHCSCTRIPSS